MELSPSENNLPEADRLSVNQVHKLQQILSQVTDNGLMALDEISECRELCELDRCISKHNNKFVNSVMDGQAVESVSILHHCHQRLHTM